MEKHQEYVPDDSDYNSRPKAAQRKKIEHIILDAQDNMKQILWEKTQEVLYLNEKILKLNGEWALA